MKKIILGLALLTAAVAVNAQEVSSRDYIEVTGTYTHKSAPDSIVVNIMLTDTATAAKSTINEQEQDMINVLKKCSIDTKTALRANTFSTSAAKRKNIAAQKSFSLTLNSSEKVDELFSGLNEKGITNVGIVLMTLKNMEVIQLSCKAKALENAKHEATTLLNAIGAKLGKPIYIMDSRSYFPVGVYAKTRALAMDSAGSNSVESEPAVEFNDVVITSNITARFLIE